MSDTTKKGLKPGWRRVRFGEVVRQCKERVDPDTSGLQRYIAGEHMDTDDLRLQRWGEIGSGYLGPAFHMRFQPGQVLYGSRRTYLRKVAVADFEGICANTTFVLESRNHRELLPEFLPFLMQTEAFHEFSVKNSKGSVNPYINFSDLERFEFSLPPLSEQQTIAERLRSAIDVVRTAQGLVATLKTLLSSYLAGAIAVRSDAVPLQDLCSSPITYGIVQAGPDMPGGIPYVRVSEMTNCDELNPLRMMKTSEEVHRSYARTTLEEGDIVIALRGVPGLAHMVPPGLAGGNLSRGVARIAVGDRCLSAYLLWAIRSPVVQRSVLQYANGWKGEDLREITIADLRRLPIPLPEKPRQQEVAKNAAELQVAISSATRRVEAASTVQRAIAAQALSGGI